MIFLSYRLTKFVPPFLRCFTERKHRVTRQSESELMLNCTVQMNTAYVLNNFLGINILFPNLFLNSLCTTRYVFHFDLDFSILPYIHYYHSLQVSCSGFYSRTPTFSNTRKVLAIVPSDNNSILTCNAESSLLRP